MPYRHDDARERARSELAVELARVRERPRSDERREDERAILARISALDLPRKRRALPSLPLLPRLRIASPCGESWDAMVGSDRGRPCPRRPRDRLDLSPMTSDEAESLLRAHDALPDGGLPCVRFYRRADGTILTADCVPGTATKRAIQAALAAVALTSASATAAVLTPGEAPAHRVHFDVPHIEVDLPHEPTKMEWLDRQRAQHYEMGALTGPPVQFESLLGGMAFDDHEGAVQSAEEIMAAVSSGVSIRGADERE